MAMENEILKDAPSSSEVIFFSEETMYFMII